MNDITRLFSELYYEVFKVSFLHSLLDSLLVLLALLTFGFILNVNYYVAIALSILFFIADLIIRMRLVKLKYIEDHNPQIREILRTARDNYDQDNYMVRAMFEDLVDRMRSVSPGSIIKAPEIFVKSLLICMLMVNLIFIASNNYHISRETFQFDPLEFFSRPTGKPMSFYGVVFNESDEGIYGVSRLAKLGVRNITLQINPSANRIDFSEVKPPEEKEFEAGAFPGEVRAVA
ncbi:hypothetical protein HZB03_02710, partial [Candidatus Woesearchaeota archaeon]|nr:hypothetical protein [Candidatus Woesearchaeota archaeon]